MSPNEKRAAAGYGAATGGDDIKRLDLNDKASFNPGQTRVPSGQPDGGQWTGGDDGEGDLVHPVIKKPSGTRKPKSGQSGKDGAKDVPSWVREGGQRPLVGEDGKTFAKRLLDEKYGPGKYNTGANSEFSQIQKWVDRHFE